MYSSDRFPCTEATLTLKLVVADRYRLHDVALLVELGDFPLNWRPRLLGHLLVRLHQPAEHVSVNLDVRVLKGQLLLLDGDRPTGGAGFTLSSAFAALDTPSDRRKDAFDAAEKTVCQWG